MIFDVFLAGFTKEKPPVALTESDLSELLAALEAGEMTDTIRSSLEWILQQLIEAERPRSSAWARMSAPRPAPRNATGIAGS